MVVWSEDPPAEFKSEADVQSLLNLGKKRFQDPCAFVLLPSGLNGCFHAKI